MTAGGLVTPIAFAAFLARETRTVAARRSRVRRCARTAHHGGDDTRHAAPGCVCGVLSREITENRENLGRVDCDRK